MRCRSLLVFLCALMLGLTAFSSTTSASTSPPPKLADPTATAKPLLVRFFTLLQRRDTAGLDRFLSPAFQVERPDGTGSSKAEYLAHYPTVESFDISHVSATQADSVLVVRYLVTVKGLVHGKPFTPGPAPRLSSFSWNGSRWQLAAHANFNPLTG
ncbi:nuclear transport factor 2 family protein [Streptomyces sp. Li-HN-5-11]|uniref:nuclear transport factor 2 family protein n=1 Tax=Streptomyces sp. Li-HN-5-11 TaxID=3075432 RepID=UPI0028ADE75A|nr:nuclear transport factor 2 family protein [Streptomyces sp. Li-HN-5-11]WNM34952.1 nuclear transport factor 2 family protein [Streptomyces sp. Li-HN-5-11]